MTTDYDLPSWFWDEDTTDADRSLWMTHDRCRRQARRQTMPSLEAMQRRVDRLSAGSKPAPTPPSSRSTDEHGRN